MKRALPLLATLSFLAACGTGVAQPVNETESDLANAADPDVPANSVDSGNAIIALEQSAETADEPMPGNDSMPPPADPETEESDNGQVPPPG